jgi:transcriptional regulator with XRE-family HTH domain
MHRKSQKVSQEKLAEKADLHPKYVSEVERGSKTISVDALARIAKALGTTVNDLTAGF